MKRILMILCAVAITLSLTAGTSIAREKIMVFPRHTWNAADATDSVPGYERNMHHLEKSIFVPRSWKGSDITFVSLGANQEVTLYVNGNKVGYHAGGYTAFSMDVTPYIHPGQDNVIAADITNEHNPDIPPLSADFTFFGGFYRDNFLLRTGKKHFSTTFYGTNGIIVDNNAIQTCPTGWDVTAHLTGCDGSESVRILVNGQVNTTQAVPAGQSTCQLSVLVDNPRLWSPNDPHLYQLTFQLLDRRGRIIDEIQQQCGLRYYRFNEQGLFELNGEVTRLIGTNRHQCYAGVGYATPDSIHRLDMLALKNMGGNFLRVSHYPQDPLIMHLCDSLGILTSVEIPVVNAITESDAFTANCLHMTDEMVWQNRNYASVVLWGYMNEVLLRPPFRYQKGMWKRHWEYVMNVNKLAGKLNDRLHELDKERYTFAAVHDYFKEYQECGLDTLADVIGHNIYSGWYSNTIESLDAKVERLHKQMNGRPQIMSEYGADCDVNLRSADPKKFDYTLDYAMLYHRHYLHVLMTTDKMAGGMAWNLNDFHSESRGGAIPHLNLKGLITLDRTPKATYYFYQSQLHPDSAVRMKAEQQMNELLNIPQAQTWPMCLLLASNRIYIDNKGLVWIPSDNRCVTYGGVPYVRKTNHGDLPASDVTILGTEEWARYQTALMGADSIHLDVSDGQYRLTLSFCELETIGEQEMSPYNLGNKALDTGFNGRVQRVKVNENVVWDGQQLDTYRAIDIPIQLTVQNGKGIMITLEATQGATIINALKLEKL
jgi:beta-galactosidase